MKSKRGFTTTSEERGESKLSSRPSAVGANAQRAFTLVELIVVVAIIGFIASAILVGLTTTQLDARDKRRISDLRQIEAALNLYYSRYNSFPTEASGANGNMSTNSVFLNAIKPFMQGTPNDPVNLSDTYYYYYDGKHSCGGKDHVVIFVRHMDKVENSNYNAFLNTTCLGSLDGEGRGGGTQSYNLIVSGSGG
jgi:general secretion pathway protein G